MGLQHLKIWQKHHNAADGGGENLEGGPGHWSSLQNNATGALSFIVEKRKGPMWNAGNSLWKLKTVQTVCIVV